MHMNDDFKIYLMEQEGAVKKKKQRDKVLKLMYWLFALTIAVCLKVFGF